MSEKQEVIEAEAVQETQALVKTDKPVLTPGLFGTTEPVEIITKAASVATALKEVVVKQGLVSNINGKQYPRCEAWTLLGTMLGVFPVLTWTHKIEGGWEARVEARTKDGAVVGAAEAQCLSAEKNWSNRDDFAIRSMAQTRATAKCLRMPLGFVMTLSGFEPTPAEEMVSEPPKAVPRAPVAKPAPAKPVKQPLKGATEKTKEWFLNSFEPEEREMATQFCMELGWIMPNEGMNDLPLRFIPVSKQQLASFRECLRLWVKDGKVGNPYLPNKYSNAEPNVPHATQPEHDNGSVDYVPPEEADAWRQFPMPFGKNAGVALEDLEKNYLYGLWANYTVETEYKGKPKKPETIAKDQTFRAMLDLAGAHYQFTKKD